MMENKTVYITFDELGIVICKADTKRKITDCVFDKICLHSVPIFHMMGYVFRDKNNPKKYYTVEEIEEKVKKYLYA